MDDLIALIARAFSAIHIFALKEVGVITESVPEGSEDTPASALVEVRGCIGISSWILPRLYAHATARLLKNKQDIDASTSLLLCTPDNLTAWNVRKAWTKPETVLTELEFSRLMITRAPKSAESWSHRSWVLRTFLFPLSPEQVDTELLLAWIAASRKPHNYYAGVHRSRMLRWMSMSVIRREQERSRKWLRTHVSDSSGWWYHRALLTLSNEHNDETERNWFHDMDKRYGDTCQSIVIHRRLGTNQT